MAFTVNDFHDMIRLLENHPEWLSDLRRLILGDDYQNILALLKEIVELNKKYEARFSKIESDIEILKQGVSVLKQDVSTLKVDVTDLKGSDLERRIRERPHIYFGKYVRRARTVDDDTLAAWLDNAVKIETISQKQSDDAELIDGAVRGKGTNTYSDRLLAVEVAGRADQKDVDRAIRRAKTIGIASLIPTMPIVAGRVIDDAYKTMLEQNEGGWVIINTLAADVN
jgi:hypothetical protein